MWYPEQIYLLLQKHKMVGHRPVASLKKISLAKLSELCAKVANILETANDDINDEQKWFQDQLSELPTMLLEAVISRNQFFKVIIVSF